MSGEILTFRPARVPPLEGRRFGRLTVLAFAEKTKHGESRWECRCDCGVTKVITRTGLISGRTVSCGCRHRDLGGKTTHGMSTNPLYFVWSAMVQRCINPKSSSYSNYGGRGITVCERWRTFEHFYADMGDRPEGLSLERIDNNGHYEPGNCRWATPAEQVRNTRRSVRISFNGKTQSMTEWAEEFGLTYSTIRRRRQQGETPPYLFRPADKTAGLFKRRMA